MEIPSDFFTVTSLGTLAGASAAVFIVTSVFGYLMNSRRSETIKKWLGLALSFVVAFLAASLIEDKAVSVWIIAIFNGFLIYFTAIGANTITAAAVSARAPAVEPLIATLGATKKAKGAEVSPARGHFSDRWW
jgi:uncharacterized membrane protein